MADEEEGQSMPPSKSRALSLRPTINLPPRSSMESLFSGGSGFGFGFSPGPMTLVSGFFSDTDDCKSFSQLLAGAISPPGFTPAPLLDSPAIFSSSQGPFGMSHQQALAQVTLQAAQAYSHKQLQEESSSSSSVAPPAAAASSAEFSALFGEETADQQMPPPFLNSAAAANELSDVSQSDRRVQTSLCSVDRPADDGYNWRKYGQKQVKGSEFPRSYYKCTHRDCPVKKKVERSPEGHVIEIIYKGEHNHEPPPRNKLAKDTRNSNGFSSIGGSSEISSRVQSRGMSKLNDQAAVYPISKKDQDSSHVTHEQLSGPSDSEEGSEIETGVNQKDDDEPNPKRRNTEVRAAEPVASHRTLTESRIIVQTKSEVDLLDDGYRWRKYGQKVVKGNPYPRSYYKCTTQGCNVRKQVERAAADQKAVVTTYEGKHNHDVPASKTSSCTAINNNVSQLKSQNMATEKQPVGLLRLKEEQIA